jgi:hypothetical protein
MADEKKTDSDAPNQMQIYYQRARHYRTIHADGAQLGLTPRAAIQFTLYSDQKPMPEFVLHEITPEGNLGKVLEEVVKSGVIREVEVNVVMDVNVATSFVNVLQGLLAQVKSLQELASKKTEPQIPLVSAV